MIKEKIESFINFLNLNNLDIVYMLITKELKKFFKIIAIMNIIDLFFAVLIIPIILNIQIKRTFWTVFLYLILLIIYICVYTFNPLIIAYLVNELLIEEQDLSITKCFIEIYSKLIKNTTTLIKQHISEIINIGKKLFILGIAYIIIFIILFSFLSDKSNSINSFSQLFDFLTLLASITYISIPIIDIYLSAFNELIIKYKVSGYLLNFDTDNYIQILGKRNIYSEEIQKLLLVYILIYSLSTLIVGGVSFAILSNIYLIDKMIITLIIIFIDIMVLSFIQNILNIIVLTKMNLDLREDKEYYVNTN